jgi:hypothetical protein
MAYLPGTIKMALLRRIQGNQPAARPHIAATVWARFFLTAGGGGDGYGLLTTRGGEPGGGHVNGGGEGMRVRAGILR